MKRRFKIILDIIMFLAALTLFDKQLVSMHYHEIAGLVLTGLLVIHIAVNIKTVVGMTKKFIKIPASLKVGLVVDVLLILCFALVAVSGIFISHTVLTSISSRNVLFKMLHMFSGALSVILLGIHIGLHICRKPMPAVAALVISALALCGGIYGAVNSNEIRQLSMPFISVAPADGASKSIGRPEGHNDEVNQSDKAQKKGLYDEQENGGDQGMQEGQRKGDSAQSTPLSQKVENVIMYLGMILSCTMITYWVFVPKKKRSMQ